MIVTSGPDILKPYEFKTHHHRSYPVFDYQQGNRDFTVKNETKKRTEAQKMNDDWSKKKERQLYCIRPGFWFWYYPVGSFTTKSEISFLVQLFPSLMNPSNVLTTSKNFPFTMNKNKDLFFYCFPEFNSNEDVIIVNQFFPSRADSKMEEWITSGQVLAAGHKAPVLGEVGPRTGQ